MNINEHNCDNFRYCCNSGMTNSLAQVLYIIIFYINRPVGIYCKNINIRNKNKGKDETLC